MANYEKPFWRKATFEWGLSPKDYVEALLAA
jgi:hypothetical protein